MINMQNFLNPPLMWKSFQYKGFIIFLQEVVEPIAFLFSQNLWLIF